MSDFFNRNKEDSKTKSNETKTAPGTQIYYHPELIDELTKDHQVLVELAGTIKQLYDDGAFDSIRDMLSRFGSLLRGHLLKENIKLYAYLQHVLAGDEENTALMQGFRNEIKDIGRTVTAFLHKYSKRDWDIELRTSFGGEFDKVLTTLGKRIQTEESILYKLYLPPDAYR